MGTRTDQSCDEGSIIDAKYICDSSDYRIVNLDNELLLKIKDHDFESDSSEIGSFNNVFYCTSTKKYWS